MTDQWGQSSVHAGVMDALGREITDGTVSAGYRYTLEGLQERFNLTRTGAREVMRTLEALGLVTPRRSVGVIVNQQHQWHVSSPQVIKWRLAGGRAKQQFRELAQLRVAVEPIAAAEMATQAPSHVRERLVQIGRQLQGLMDESRVEEFLALDTEFHTLILRYCGNAMFSSFEPVVASTHSLRGRDGLAPFRPEESVVRAHLELAQAIERGDEAAAEQHACVIADELRHAVDHELVG